MKLQLTINGGTLIGRTFDLESGFLTIGRGDTCSVRFDPLSERIASKQHAFIEAKADGYYLTDNQSTNGTLLNGSIVMTAKLSNGDQIQFGRNGVTATVGVSIPDQQAAIPLASFRDQQVAQFNQIAAKGPVSVQKSLSNLGLGNISPVKTEPDGSPTKHYLVIAVGVMVIVFLAIVAFLVVSSGLSRSTDGSIFTLNLGGVILAIMASFIAFIPALVYILPLIWLDRYDPEPAWLLAIAFAWGAFVAIIVSYVVNTSIGFAAYALTRDEAVANAISGIISAPIFEEGSKGLGVVLLLIFFRKYFDDILDGIVFAGVVALGFATVENVLYYGRGIDGAIATGQLSGLVFMFVLRGIMSPFAHVTFTSMTGIGCGISRESHNKLLRFVMPLVGYLCAMTLHGIWNAMAFLGGLGGFVIGYIVLEVPFFLIWAGFSWYVMRRQGKILREMLAIDIARGLISQELGTIVTSPIKSSMWLVQGLFSGKYWARSHYLQAAGKLGLSYWHIQRATEAQGQTGSFQQNPILREAVLKWRDQV
jgi:RsiW-degrading membrane proteinase PrsW (M82 family)